MSKKIIIVMFSATLITGCAGAQISSNSWASSIDSANVKTRCEEVDMRSNREMSKVFTKYDGWKLKYISEYTTGNKVGTSGVACFEHLNE